MQLKRLEAYGFKSFADKIEIEFNPGITAIVGPNGSGKSNITDAIRWVLGEQNVRNLRGSKAEDIIFTGSASRRALGVAEVSLIFDNDGKLPVDFKEVVVTRRLFRSGESEFYINKSRCRLKDINNLFADTGLGHDGMSVIGQNKIDDILNSKPEERRLFFEETAGITKYRNRKKESLRKLDDTENNLIRVNDIIHEVENQLEPLAEHAEKTRQYNALQEDYKKCKLTELFRKEEKLRSDRDSSQQKVQLVRDQELEAQTAVQTTEARKEQLGKEILDVEQQLQALSEKNNVLRDKIEAANSEIAILAERSKQRDADHARILAQRTELEKSAASADADREKLLAEEKEQQSKLALADELLLKEREKSKALAAQVREQKESSRVLAEECQQQQKKLLEKQNELTLLERELENNTASRAEREKSMQTAKTALQELRSEVKELSVEKAQNMAAQVRSREEQQAGKQALQKFSDEVRRLQQAEVQNQQQLHAAENKLQFLTNLQQSYEGFGKAAKAVLKAKQGWSPGICGAVAELFQVPQSYIVAIEIALGGSLQNIVTEDTETAKAAIAFLKRERLGRVTFLPLSTIVVRRPADLKVKQETGVIGYANAIIAVEPKFKKIADFLLARTLVVDTLDHALSLAKKQGYHMRIVTLEGELLSPGGSLSGGSQQHRETSFLNRSGEIEILQKAVQTAKERNVQLQQEKEQAGQRYAVAEQEFRSAEQVLQELAVQAAEQRVKAERAGLAIEERKQQLQQFEKLASEMQFTFAKVQQGRNLAAHEAQALQKKFADLTEKASAAEETLDDLEQDAEDLAKYINDRELKRAVLEQELLRSQERSLLRKREYEQAMAQIARSQEEEHALELRLQQGQQRLVELQTENTAWQQQHSEGLQSHKELYEVKMAKLVEGQKNDKAARDVAHKLNVLQSKLHQLEMQATEIQLGLEQCQNTMLEEYGFTSETAAEHVLELSELEIRKHMQELSASIAALGPVNPNAVVEYEELSKRHDFMQKQAADLVAARENLLGILKEMDITMTKQFREAFAKTGEYFGEIFVRLFGGGKAELFLTDEKDVLNAGVEIVVQLPEKKRQNLSVLSGGERALTVIALLFSFLRYKPSPFSVLDEIDAPLDEANVSRFGKFLGEFSDNTQFIVVTHRKGTMEAANFMYGITIEDAGVSKVVSVRLDDID